jgi:hypothetical protein
MVTGIADPKGFGSRAVSLEPYSQQYHPAEADEYATQFAGIGTSILQN